MNDKKPGEIMDELKRNDERLMGEIARSFKGNRRGFVAALGATSLGVLLSRRAEAVPVGPLNTTQRRDRAFQIRSDQATANRNATSLAVQATNGDEERYPNKAGSYSKGLPHSNVDGTVNLTAYNSMLSALTSASPAAFENIILGGTRQQTNPQGGWAFEMEGGDGPSFKIAAPPTFRSREEAAELAENYWMALLRDVPFSQYPTNQIAIDAARDLTLFGADAKVPKNASGQVTPDLLFRGLTPGDRVGPWISQFFLLPCPFGSNFVEQRILHPTANRNFGTQSWEDFLGIQDGQDRGGQTFENVLRYMRSGRGIGEWVHVDVLFQAYFMAFLILASQGARLDANNPYNNSRTQIGFATFGGPHIATLLCEVSTRALHATWYQKWFAQRRLRPEAFAGSVHARLYRGANFEVHQEILNDLNSRSRLGNYFFGSALLPLAFPEGSPTHPAYTAGHATVAGACTTILKAWFDETWPIPNPRQPSTDGLSLQPFTAATLTAGGELNKVASNVANGRNIAGVHWRSDSTESLKLGEAIAIQLMREHRPTFNESFSGFSLTKFDGTTITV
jgi:hypothetical protein